MSIHLDSRFVSLVVHDLRTPLNVIGLSLRLIDQSIAHRTKDLDEDLRVVQDNVFQIERMLAHLSDYCRLIDEKMGLRPTLFNPRRMLEEVVEEQSLRIQGASIRLEFREGYPTEVDLDPNWARLAVRHALGNALAASEGSPIRAILGGGPDRFELEVRTERPPTDSVRPMALGVETYERLFGSKYERRGLDLAIAAGVTELFGGKARLDVDKDRGTSIFLDWPTRVAA